MFSKSEALNEEERAFLQRRVGAFGLVCGVSYGFFLVFRSVMALATEEPEEFVHPAWWYHLLATLCFLGVFGVSRFGRLHERGIKTTETLGLLGGVVFSGVMAAYIGPATRPERSLL